MRTSIAGAAVSLAPLFPSAVNAARAPVKAFDAILSAVVTELQRNPSTKVKLTLEIEAQSPKARQKALDAKLEDKRDPAMNRRSGIVATRRPQHLRRRDGRGRHGGAAARCGPGRSRAGGLRHGSKRQEGDRSDETEERRKAHRRPRSPFRGLSLNPFAVSAQ